MRLAALCLLLAGCTQAGPVKLDFVCRSRPQGSMIVTECADPATWDEWIEKHKRSSADMEM